MKILIFNGQIYNLDMVLMITKIDESTTSTFFRIYFNPPTIYLNLNGSTKKLIEIRNEILDFIKSKKTELIINYE